MKQLVFDSKTRLSIDRITMSPPNTLILIGHQGAGKFALAKYITETALLINNIDNYAYSLIVSPTKDSITIDNIRSIERFLLLKVPSFKSINRSIIIDQADKLTKEAQNALLKTLEEPPKDSLIILTVNNLNSLLSTITSRAQKLNVNLPKERELKDFFVNQDFPKETVDQAYLLSKGLPGTMFRILNNPDDPLILALKQAKLFLGANTYQRSILINDFAKDKVKLQDLIEVMEIMAETSLKNNANNKIWQNVLKSSYYLKLSLSRNSVSKLALTKFVIDLVSV
jgi:hypothetical protein